MKYGWILGISVIALGGYGAWLRSSALLTQEEFLHEVNVRSFNVEVSSLGELEAASSQMISSRLKGDQAKVIYLIADGATVKAGDLLMRIDPGPYETKVNELKGKLVEQTAYLQILQQTIDWETHQTKMENQSADFELQSAVLEQDKLKHGDGPIEVLRVEAALQRAKISFEELQGFNDDLALLDGEGFLNPAEKKMALKKLTDAQETYDSALAQRNSYVEHVYPMLLKKGEAAIKRASIKKDETVKSGEFRIAKAFGALNQAKIVLRDLQNQLKDAEGELALTEIKAPSSGMVVFREDFRNGQKRKIRVGDILVRNQPVIDLPDLKQMIVRTKVREIDLHKIGIDKWAMVEVEAYPHLSLIGKVASIGVLALADPTRAGDEKYFEVKVAIHGTNPNLRPGMSSKVFIQCGKVKLKPAVPLHAVFLDGKKAFVYVQNETACEKRPVTLGLCNHEWAEIVQGLSVHEKIVLKSGIEEDTDAANFTRD